MILEWYRYCTASLDKSKTNWYLIPFDGTDAYQEGTDLSLLRKAKICTNGVMEIMEIRKGRFSTITKAANTTGFAKSHGNTGKSNAALKEDDPRMDPIKAHFDELMGLGEA